MNTVSDLFAQYSKPLATAASVLLVILISLSLANGVLFFIEQTNQPEVAPNQPGALIQPRKTLNIEQITGIFGQVQTAVINKPVDAPKTTLNLELNGVFTAEDPAGSTAIIAQRGKSGELYRIGDRLPGNATLEAVFDDHVLIKRGARTEKLMYSDSPLTQGISRTGTEAGAGPRITQINPGINDTSRLQQVRERIARRSQEIAAERGTSQSNSNEFRQVLEDYQQRLSDDPQTVLDELGLETVESESGAGYRIGSEIPEGMLRQVGLRQGDVIRTVNGKPAADAAADSTFQSEVLGGGTVSLELERDGRIIRMSAKVPQ